VAEVSEKEFGALEERVRGLPGHEHLTAIERGMTAAIERVGEKLGRQLEKHEGKTSEKINEVVMKTVEAAFNLQWEKIENKIAREVGERLPPKQKREWMPYIVMVGMLVFAGIERALPFAMRYFGG